MKILVLLYVILLKVTEPIDNLGEDLLYTNNILLV